MLQALYQMALDEGLMKDPDYEPKAVAYLVRVGDGGKLLGIESTRTTAPVKGKAKPKLVPTKMLVPRQPIRTSGDVAFFLCDKCEYALGLIAPTDPDRKNPIKLAKKETKLCTRHQLFRSQVEECARVTGDPGATAVLKFLDRLTEDPQLQLADDCGASDLFAFTYAQDDCPERRVHDRPAVREFWGAKRSRARPEDADRRCLVTGTPLSEIGNFDKIKRVPGDNGSDKSLVSFNANAFESFGWDGNENAPIGRDATEACSTALNRLLDPAYPDPENSYLALRPHHVRISDDTVVCYWGRGKKGRELADWMSELLIANDPEIIGDLFRSVWRGRAPTISDPSKFYAVTLTGIKGRIIVRDWLETTVGAVADNLANHFRDLAIVRNTRPPKDRTLPPVIPLPVLLRSLAPMGDEKGIPDALAAQFIRTALQGGTYPFAILQKALERARAEVGRTEWADSERRDARAALIKAVLLRRTNHQIGVSMNPNSTSEGYNLGCLMAVLERLQELALENVNASVIDRYFAAASATPRSVFVRLLRNAQHHARKARENDKSAGMARLLKKLIDELADRFHVDSGKPGYAAPNGFPSFLPLEQQGLFVIGYHQMRKWLWMSKEERSAWGKEYPGAPRAFQWGSKESTDSTEGTNVIISDLELAAQTNGNS